MLDQITADPAAYGLTGLACPALPNTDLHRQSRPEAILFYGDQLHLTSAGFAIVGQYIAAQLQAPLMLQAASDMSLDVARQFGRTLTSRMDTRRAARRRHAGRFQILPRRRRLSPASWTPGQTNDAYRSSGVGATAGVEYGFGSGVVGARRQLLQAQDQFRQ